MRCRSAPEFKVKNRCLVWLVLNRPIFQSRSDIVCGSARLELSNAQKCEQQTGYSLKGRNAVLFCAACLYAHFQTALAVPGSVSLAANLTKKFGMAFAVRFSSFES
jgi:hypothetical protein